MQINASIERAITIYVAKIPRNPESNYRSRDRCGVDKALYLSFYYFVMYSGYAKLHA